jgi:hypothetical protein
LSVERTTCFCCFDLTAATLLSQLSAVSAATYERP